MAFLVPIIAAAFTAVATAIGTGAAVVAGAVGLDSIGTFLAVDGAITGFGSALVGASGLGAAFSAWTTTLLVGASFAGLVFGTPKPASLGQSVNMQYNPQAGLPVAFGRVGTGGVLGYRETFSSDGKNENLCYISILSAGGPITSIDSYYGNNLLLNWNTNPLTAGSSTSAAWAECTSVTPTATSGQKVFKNQTFAKWKLGVVGEDAYESSPSFTASLPNWTTASKLSGLASAATIFRYDPTGAFPDGPPSQNIWVVRGVSCYDPRQDSTFPGGSGSCRLGDQTTYIFSQNPAIHALQWCIGWFENGIKTWGIGANINELDAAAFVAAANVADANGWTGGGVVSTTDDRFSVLSTILQSIAAQPINNNGILSVIYDSPKTALYDIGIDDVVGSIQIQNTTSYRDRKNRIVPSYMEEANFWTITAGDLVTADAFLEEDGGGTQNWRTITQTYPLIQQATQAHQVAAYNLCDTREFLTATIECGLRMRNAQVGDALTVTLPDVCLNTQKFIVMGTSLDFSTQKITLNLRSETDSKHAFALGQSATAPTAPELTAYDPSNPAAPGSSAWSITGTAVTNANGLSIPAIVIDGAVDDPNAASVITEYRTYGASAWTQWAEVTRDSNNASMQFAITSVTSGDEYEAAVSYRTVKGIVSQRLILNPDPVIIGDQVISWSTGAGGANAGVINIPVGLTTDSNGMLSSSNIIYESSGDNQTIDAALDSLTSAVTNAVSDASNAANTVSTYDASLIDLSNSVISDALSTQNLQTFVNGNIFVGNVPVNAAILNESNYRVAGDTALASTLAIIGTTGGGGTTFLFNIANVQTSPGVSLGSWQAGVEALANSVGSGANAAILAQITSEQNARIAGDTALANSIAVTAAQLVSNTATLLSQITTETSARIANNLSIANTVTTLGAELVSNTTAIYAAIASNATTLTTSIAAETSARTTLASQFNTANSTLTSAITNEASTRSTAISGLASTIAQIGVVGTGGSGFILNTGTVSLSSGGTLASELSGLSAATAAVSAAVTTETTARTTAVSSLSSQITSLTSTVTTNNTNVYAAITSEATTRATAVSSLTTSVTSLNSSYGSLSGTVSTLSSTVSSNYSTLSSQISTVSTTVSGHTSSISSISSSVGGLEAQYVLQVSGSAGVIGYALASGAGGATFNVYAPNFNIINSSGSGAAPFSVTGGVVTMQNVVINGSLLVNGTIQTAHLAVGAASAVAASQSSPGVNITTSPTSYITQAVTSQGGKFLVMTYIEISPSGGNSGAQVYLYRDGSLVDQTAGFYQGSFDSGQTFIFEDQPAAGSHTYAIYVNKTSGSAGTTILNRIKIIAQELRQAG
jgi:hypothetical protein